MPPLPALRVSALARLADELRFAPRAAARRHVARAEDLLDRLRDDQAYPEDFLVFAITGYRPDTPDPALVPGDAVRADLAPLIERLSAAAGWTRTELGAGWMTAPDVCGAWKVSKSTLDRYRRLGLPARRVSGPRGRTVLVFERGRVERFLAAHRPRLAKAASFSRIDDALAERLLARAVRYRRWLGWSITRTARRLAERFGRSPEAVRQVLKRRPAAAGARAAPLSARDRRLVERAVRLGVGLTTVARRLNTTVPSIHRAFWMRRAELLRGFDLATAEAPFDGRPRLIDELLKHPAAREGLGRPAPGNLLEYLTQTLAAGWPDAATELARARAFAGLVYRARANLAQLSRTAPRAGPIEAAQADLLWAARLLAELVRSQQMLVLKSVESRFDRGIEDLPPVVAQAIVRDCAVAVADAARKYDPFKPAAAGQPARLAAPAGLAVNRVLARLATAHASVLDPPAGRAAPKAPAPPAQIMLTDWTRRLAPWQYLVDASSAARAAAGQDTVAARLIRARFGLPPHGRPLTLEQAAKAEGVSPLVAARLVHAALSAARAHRE